MYDKYIDYNLQKMPRNILVIRIDDIGMSWLATVVTLVRLWQGDQFDLKHGVTMIYDRLNHSQAPHRSRPTCNIPIKIRPDTTL